MSMLSAASRVHSVDLDIGWIQVRGDRVYVFKASGSSSVDFIAFDPKVRKMYVRYTSGPKLYSVENVDKSVYDEICAATSVGKALGGFLKQQKTSASGSSTFKLTDEESNRVLAAVQAMMTGGSSAIERAVADWQIATSNWF